MIIKAADDGRPPTSWFKKCKIQGSDVACGRKNGKTGKIGLSNWPDTGDLGADNRTLFPSLDWKRLIRGK